MSETNSEPKTENNIDEKEQEEGPKKGKRSGVTATKRLSSLAKEAEAILKGFGDKEDAPEGRRTTRSSLRGTTTPVSTTPSPAKRERKSSSTNSTSNNSGARSISRRGKKSKKGSEDEKANDDRQEETNAEEDVAMKESEETALDKNGDEISEKKESAEDITKGAGDKTVDKDTKEKTDKPQTETFAITVEGNKADNKSKPEEQYTLSVVTTNGTGSSEEEEKRDKCKGDEVTGKVTDKIVLIEPSEKSIIDGAKIAMEEKSLNSEKETLLMDTAVSSNA